MYTQKVGTNMATVTYDNLSLPHPMPALLRIYKPS